MVTREPSMIDGLIPNRFSLAWALHEQVTSKQRQFSAGKEQPMYFPRFLAITGLTAAMLVPATATRSYAAQTTTKSTVAADDSTIHSRVEKAIKAQPTLKD